MRAPLVTFLFLSTLLCGQQKPGPSSELLILTNVNIVDTRSGQVRQHLTVVIKNGRIASIARVALIGGGRDVHVVNASGKYLVPGLWDMHVHSAGGPAAAWDQHIIFPLEIANGVTGIRDMGGDPDLLRQRRQRIEKGELLGPRLVMAGPFLSDGKSDAETIAVNTPAEGRQAVDTLKKQDVDFIKVLSVSRDSYLAIAEEAARQHLPFAGHVPLTVSASQASSSGQHSIEHLSGILLACSARESELRQQQLQARARQDWESYSEAGAQVMTSYSSDKASGLFIQLRHNATWQVPTLVWHQADAHLDDPDITTDARLKYVPASVREQWLPERLLKQTTPKQRSALKQAAERYLELTRAMHRAGVPFLAGTDGPDPYVFPGFSLHDELELLVQAGFTPAQALQTATFYPAQFLGKLDQYGVVEKGRVADLVLLAGNPLEDIRNTRKIEAVVVGGKLYSRDDLDKILAEVEDLAAKQ